MKKLIMFLVLAAALVGTGVGGGELLTGHNALASDKDDSAAEVKVTSIATGIHSSDGSMDRSWTATNNSGTTIVATFQVWARGITWGSEIVGPVVLPGGASVHVTYTGSFGAVSLATSHYK